MGRFLNPDYSAFETALNSEIYIDKTGLLAYTNKVINTKQAFICNSRPRRFGKSVTADMLTAYYSKGCDSADIFADYEISHAGDFRQHLNKYDVIHLDIQWCLAPAKGAAGVVSYIEKSVIAELKEKYPEAHLVEQGLWNSLQRPPVLDPADPLFEQMAKVWYTEYEKLYGKADLFGGCLLYTSPSPRDRG